MKESSDLLDAGRIHRDADTGTTVDALTLLREDHRRLEELFDDYRDAVESALDPSGRAELARRACQLLATHAQLEEELFYPMLRDALDDALLLDEAQVQHSTLKELLAKVRSSSPGEAFYDARMNVLGQYLQHHVRHEEDELFAFIESSELDLDELGARMAGRRREIESGADVGLGG